MDAHYDWSDPEFVDECGESLNLAVNAVADVLHTPHNEVDHERRATSIVMVRSQRQMRLSRYRWL